MKRLPATGRGMPEARLAEVIRVDRRPAGRSSLTMRCPFCGSEVEARVWGLAGSGKRCDCRVVFTRGPDGAVLATKRDETRTERPQ